MESIYKRGRRAAGVLMVTGLCALCAAVNGESATSGTVEAKAAETTATAKVAAATGQVTVALIGEKPVIAGKGKKQHPDVAGMARLLGGKVVDFTEPNQTLEETAKGLATAAGSRPDIAVLFAGAGDEKAGTKDQSQQKALKTIVGSLAGAGVRVYVVPSSPALGPLTTSNLRLSSGGQATFIETGSQIAGRPYEEAIESISRAEKNPKPAATPMPVVTATPAATAARAARASTPVPPVERAPQPRLAIPPLEETTPVAAKPGKEPSKVFAAPTPAKSEDLVLSKTPVVNETESQTTSSRFVTKRGPEAVPMTINMRPPPALKTFSPVKPVPRNDVNKKAPELAR